MAGDSPTLRILLVEDNPADALFVREGLERLQTPTRLQVCMAAEEAMTALALAARNIPVEPPDVVFLDLNLPGLTGLELLALLRRHERTKDVCVLVLSSSTAERDVARAMAAGADDYLLKPMRLVELFALLAQVEERWLKPLFDRAQRPSGGE